VSDKPVILRHPTYSADGIFRIVTYLSVKCYEVGTVACLPPRTVVPIVFVPGIMGSNLKVRDRKLGPDSAPWDDTGEVTDEYRKEVQRKTGIADPVPWRPPNGMKSGLAVAKTWKGYSPGIRQVFLNPDTTMVESLPVPLKNELIRPNHLSSQEEAQRRGWGTVHWDSYGSFLASLDEDLTALFSTIHHAGVPRDAVGLLTAGEGFSGVNGQLHMTKDQLKAMGKFWMPVHAVGYNWLQSNAHSAEYLKVKIQAIISHYAKTGFDCEKVILVTHSMGGLVARAFAKDNEQLVMGVVHGAMPTVGTPVAYRRMVAGVEESMPGRGPVMHLMLHVAANYIGSTAMHTTPVMANSAGCLELLPSQAHPPGWLRIEREDGDGGLHDALPRNDPYQEIYSQRERWYKLVDEGLLDPAGMSENPEGAWNKFLNKLNLARYLHHSVIMDGNTKPFFHPKTYVFYVEKGLPTYNSIKWKISGHGDPIDYRDAISLGSNARGMLHIARRPIGKKASYDKHGNIRNYNVRIGLQEGHGDGTVSKESGAIPKIFGAKNVTALRGFDHQDIFSSHYAKGYVIWAISKIVGT
jgi:hypothetical protein